MAAGRRFRAAQRSIEPIVYEIAGGFAKDALGLAWSEFSESSPEELNRDGPEASLFHPWVIYDWLPPFPGRKPRSRQVCDASVAEICLRRLGPKLEVDDLLFLTRSAAEPLSFHEVVSLVPGRSLVLRDVLRGLVREVYEESGSTTLQVGNIIFARVVPYDGAALILNCGSTAIPPIEKAVLLQLRRTLKKSFKSIEGALLQELEPELRELYFEIRERLRHPPMPELHNTDGDPIEFHTLRYSISSPEVAFEALHLLAAGHGKEDLLRHARKDKAGVLRKVEFTWAKLGNRMHGSWDNTILGSIRIDGPHMTIEVNSAKRSRKIQAEVRRLLGKEASLDREEVKTLDQAMSEPETDISRGRARRAAREQEALMSMPEVQEFMREQANAHWEGWVDERIPALGGRTPRQAVKTADGREMVEALLLDYERGDSEINARVHLDRVRRQLGLAEP